MMNDTENINETALRSLSQVEREIRQEIEAEKWGKGERVQDFTLSEEKLVNNLSYLYQGSPNGYEDLPNCS